MQACNALDNKTMMMNSLSIKFLDLVDIRIPDELPIAESITNVYDRSIDAIKVYQTKMVRCAEDIRDIYERQRVIDNLTKINDEKYKKHSKLRNDYENKKATPDGPKLKEELIKFKEQLKEETLYLIDQVERFEKFQINRLTHAFVLYSQALEEFGVSDEMIFRELNERLSSYSKQRNLQRMESAQ